MKVKTAEKAKTSFGTSSPLASGRAAMTQVVSFSEQPLVLTLFLT